MCRIIFVLKGLVLFIRIFSNSFDIKEKRNALIKDAA
jgi:hypothetical protein